MSTSGHKGSPVQLCVGGPLIVEPEGMPEDTSLPSEACYRALRKQKQGFFKQKSKVL